MPLPAPSCTCRRPDTNNNNQGSNEDKNNNNSLRQTEQGRDAEGKWISKNPGEAAPGAEAEKKALDAIGATKNTEAIPGSNQIPDGRIQDSAGKVIQYAEAKSGASVSNTRQLREMARAAIKATGKRLKLVITNPKVKIAETVTNNKNIELVRLNQK